MSIFGPIEAACKITFFSYHLFTFFEMNDIVQSQDKSMEGHLQFLLKVRGLKGKSFRNKVRSTKLEFCGGMWGFKTKMNHGGNMDIFWNCTLL